MASAGATGALYGAAVTSIVCLDTRAMGSSAMICEGVNVSPGVKLWNRIALRDVCFSHCASNGQPLASGVHAPVGGTFT